MALLYPFRQVFTTRFITKATPTLITEALRLYTKVQLLKRLL